MNNKGTIAILGGMGPQASAKMLEVMVDMAAKEFGAKNGDDFPEIILFSLPIPDFISSKKSLKKAELLLKEKINLLNKLNISSIVLACNTAHIMFDDLESVSKGTFVSMIEAVADEVGESGLAKVGILGTPSTIKTNLYQTALKKRGIRVVVPDKIQIRSLEIAIRKVIAKTASSEDRSMVEDVAKSLVERGAEGIILGCTELPLIFPYIFVNPVFDSIRITVKALLMAHFNYGKKGFTIN